MTEEEVFKQITSVHKWYIGYCGASYASQMIHKFEDKRLGRKAIDRLFRHFGYELETGIKWKKYDQQNNF